MRSTSPTAVHGWPRLSGGDKPGLLASGAIVLFGVGYGGLVPEVWRLGLLAGGLIVVAAWTGLGTFLRFLLLTSGITLAFVTGNQRSLGGEFGGFNLDGLRLLVSLEAFIAVALRVPALGKCWVEVWPYLGLLVWGAATLAWSPVPIEGLRFLLKLTYPLLGFALAYWVAQKENPKSLWNALAWGAVVASAINLILALQTGVWSEVGFEGRYRGGVGYNVVGHFSGMLALALLGAWVYTRNLAYLSVGLLMAIQMIATGSRTAFVSVGAGLAVLGIVRGKWRATTASVLLVATLWYVVPTLGLRTVALEDQQSASVSTGWMSSVNLSGRALIWYDVWNAIVKDHFIIGAGFGATTPFLARRFETIRHVHNEYLHILAEGGLVALGFFLIAYGKVLARLVRNSVRSEYSRAWSSVAVTMFVCFLTASVAENTLDIFAAYHFFPWCIAGVALGAGLREERNGSLNSTA